jgi:uncharacterized protein YpuA (DUF1002 family)
MAQQTDQDLRIAISNLAQEMRVGFANIDTKFANVDTKFSDLRGDIRELKGDIKALDNKFEERTKSFGQRLDAKELIVRSLAIGITNALVGGLLLGIARLLFFGKF